MGKIGDLGTLGNLGNLINLVIKLWLKSTRARRVHQNWQTPAKDDQVVKHLLKTSKMSKLFQGDKDADIRIRLRCSCCSFTWSVATCHPCSTYSQLTPPNLHLLHFVHTAPPLARQTGRECLWKRDLKCAAELRLLLLLLLRTRRRCCCCCCCPALPADSRRHLVAK